MQSQTPLVQEPEQQSEGWVQAVPLLAQQMMLLVPIVHVNPLQQSALVMHEPLFCVTALQVQIPPVHTWEVQSNQSPQGPPRLDLAHLPPSHLPLQQSASAAHAER
jgi:hypothetical protein